MQAGRALDVPILDTVYVTRILVRDDVVFGAYGFDLTDGTRYVIHADAVILAAGGHTRIWRRTSSRRDENTGDSFRLAVEAGGRIRDPELVQFHPSGLLEPENAAGTLVSEAARGEGGILRNELGERFMERYDPERMELSTRDRVALAAYTEIKEGRGTPNGGVWLDVSHLPREKIMPRLPRVYQTLLELQMLDITTTPIEVAPTAHYSMGGVWVRPEDHGTGVEGLYAIGEAVQRPARREPARRQLADRAAGLRPDRRRRPRPPTRRGSPRSALGRGDGRGTRRGRRSCSPPTGRENVRVLQRAVRDTMTEHAGRGPRRGRSAGGSRRARRDRGPRWRTSAYTPTSPDSRISRTPSTSRRRCSPPAPRWRPRSNAARPAAATTAPTTRTSTSPCRSTWSGPARPASSARPIPPSRPEIAELMREVSTDGKLVE